MKRVLVTGGCGFIGSNLVDALINTAGIEPENITVIDNLSSESSSLNYHIDEVNYIFDDVKNLKTYTSDCFDVIFHLAANARIQPSFEAPYKTLENNIIGALSILEYARDNHVGRIVYAGSSSFYHGAKKSPYSFSKWIGEETCKLYQMIYGLNVVIARFFNVYGTRQPDIGEFATVIGIFEREYAAGHDLPIIGDGNMRRDFTHIEDICKGLILLANREVSGVYNLGTGVNYSINEIADKIISRSTKPISKIYLSPRKNEALVTKADISKTKADIGYRPEHDLMEYLELVIK